MKSAGFDLESIYDSSDQTINRSLAEFLSLPSLKIDIINDFSFENLGPGVESLTPEIVAYSRRQSNDASVYQLEAVGSNLSEPCDFNDFLPRPPQRVGDEVDHMVYPPSIDFIDSEISVLPPPEDFMLTDEFGDDVVEGAIYFPSIDSDETTEGPELTPAQLLPGLVKINILLTERGYLPLTLTSADVDLSTKNVSVDAVNQWVACLSGCIQEMGERLELQQRAVQSAAMSARTGKQSYSSLLDRSEALEEKLKEARKKISLSEMQKSLLVDENSSRSKIRKSEEGDGKRLAKGYDQQLQESERRVRQRDTEIERLKTKLEAFACKERANAARLREALSSWKSGAVLTATMGTGGGGGVGSSPNNRSASSTVFNSPPAKRHGQTSPHRRDSISSASGTRRDSISSVRRESISSTTASVTPLRRESSMSFRRESLTPSSKIRRDISRDSGKQLTGTGTSTGSEETSAWDVIEALDAQKSILERRNEELSEQLDEYSRNNTSECRSMWGRERNRESEIGGESERDDVHGSSYLASKSDLFSEIDEGGMESIIENKNVGTPRCTVRAVPSHTTTPPAAKMYVHIAEQQRRIDALQSSCDKQRSKGDEGDKLCHQLRLRVQEAQQEIDELRCELSTRPTVKQWTLKLKELSESEAKRLDLEAIRRDSVELLAEREKEKEREKGREKEKEREKALMDKRSNNDSHDVDLWVLDSLPFEVTKNALKAVCRELGLDDVGDIQPSLIKLKAVVGAVPRMERFITQVCGFLFRHEEERAKTRREREEERRSRRSNGNNCSDSLSLSVPIPMGSMEHAMPLLEVWWSELQSLEGLLDFREQVVEIVILKETKNKDNISDGDRGASAPASSSSTSLSRSPHSTDAESVFVALRELTAFSLKMQHFQDVLRDADQMMVDQPDSLLSRTVQHIKRKFDVTSLEDLLPRIHQILVSAEQARNFLNAMKNMINRQRENSGDRDEDDEGGGCSTSISTSLTDIAVYSEITERMRRTMDHSDSSTLDNITGPAMIL